MENIKENTFNSEYEVNKEYVFYNSFYLIENVNVNKNSDTNNSSFNLGKFIKYLSIPYCGDMLDRGKAVFENGTINSNDFKYIN
jgi:hypothetical protein